MQSYNFPFSHQENVSQSFIDYSSASVSNIDLDEGDRTLVIYSKKSHNSQRQRLVARHQSLPYLPVEIVNDYHLNGFLHRYELNCDIPSVVLSHVDNFSAYHPDIMYGTVVDLLHEDMNVPPWSICMNIRRDRDPSMPWKQKTVNCKLCSKVRQVSLRENDDLFKAIKYLGKTVPDISPLLLENLLQESITLESSRLHFDTFMGNSLACHASKADNQAVLMYPSGAGFDILNFSNILQFSESADNDGTSSSSPSSSKPIVSMQQFSIQGQIRQIDFSSHSGNNMVIGTRSQYSCSFFQSCSTDSTDGSLVSRMVQLSHRKFTYSHCSEVLVCYA